jgi:hypothetical protein
MKGSTLVRVAGGNMVLVAAARADATSHPGTWFVAHPTRRLQPSTAHTLQAEIVEP